MTKRKVVIYRACAAILAIVAAFSLLIVLLPKPSAEAAASLPYIERLKSQLTGESGRSFNVLEIVPDSGVASVAQSNRIGWYMQGHEPSGLVAWFDSDPAYTANRTARATAATSWNTTIASSGALATIIGSGADQYPASVAPYVEGYFWDSATTYPYVLNLPQTETATVIGSITPAANGDYRAEFAYTITSTGDYDLRGGYLQRISAAPSDKEPQFYYLAPTFEQIAPNSDTFADGTQIPDGTAIYVFDGTQYEFYDYKRPGLINPAGGSAALYSDYFVVQNLGAPDATTISSECYRLVGASVEFVGTGGTLSRTLSHLTLAERNGEYNYSPIGSDTFTINYNKVRYSGGLVNNNWFSRYVLNAEDNEASQISYNVKTRTVSELSTVNPDAYDLIVVMLGSETLPAGIVDAMTREQNSVPAIFVSASAALKTQMLGAAGAPAYSNFVRDSMYFYAPTPGAAPGYAQLAMRDFHTEFSAASMSAIGGLAAVIEDINSENALRAITETDRIPVELSIATSIRHVLNRRDPRVMRPLERVRILEIQPRHIANPIGTNQQTAADTKYLINSVAAADMSKPNNVMTWFGNVMITAPDGSTHPITPADIEITTMSVLEFNGHINELSESYELIYFGDSRAYAALRPANATLKNPDLTGLLYSGIGDSRTRGNTHAAGQLDSDWTGGSFGNGRIQTSADAKTYNLPGNDITEAKKRALEDYVAAGYPVVFADDLVTTTAHELNGTSYSINLELDDDNPDDPYLKATVSYTGPDGNAYTSLRTASPSMSAVYAAAGTDIQGVFEWHRVLADGTDEIVSEYSGLLGGTTYYEIDDIWHLDVFENPGDYYCVYRLVDTTDNNAPFGTDARSNTVTITKDSVYLHNVGNPSQTVVGNIGSTVEAPKLSVSATSGIEITAEIPDSVHNALLAANSGLEYTYTLEFFAEPTSLIELGGKSYIGSASDDGMNVAVPVGTSVTTADPTHTFTISPPAIKTAYRVRIEINAPTAATLTPVSTTSADGNTVHYAYKYILVDPAAGVSTLNDSHNALSFDAQLQSEAARLTADPSAMGTARLVTTVQPLQMTTTPITLTVTATVANTSGVGVSPSAMLYQWYRAAGENDPGTIIPGATAATYAVQPGVGNGGWYYCVVTVTYNGKTTRVAGSRAQIAVETSDSGSNAFTAEQKRGYANALRPDKLSVDSMTRLSSYTFNTLRRENAFRVQDIAVVGGTTPSPEVAERRASLGSFLSLSKPTIAFTLRPTPYSNDGGFMTSNASGRQLRYAFKISDPADPTPAATTYDVRLYIDGNASGLYTSDEAVGIDVYDSTNTLLKPNGGNYELFADQEYLVQATLPKDAVGIIPWKLEITKNASNDGRTARYIHGSEIGYTRIAPGDNDKITLNVLQLVGHDSWLTQGGAVSPTNGDSGLTVILETNTVYASLIPQVEDFDIDFDTIRTDGSLYGYNSQPANILRPDKLKESETRMWQSDASAAEIYERLCAYDMLVFGFADCYNGVNENLAQALVRWIDDGRSVLFTHDTTSYINVPVGTRNNDGALSYDTYWGYEFNTKLRSRLGLDTYGLQDPAVSSILSRQTAATNLTAAEIATLTAAGYEIAYTPNGGGATEARTQGYTTYLMDEQDVGYRPGKITQVNAGQITTYPFNINLKGFEGASASAGDTLNVANTHFQYYTLNMNSDDLVVWYCLADDSSGIKYSSQTGLGYSNYYWTNDVASGYYIYTMGSITYSGVGHSAIGAAHTDEAKLFINTMIAAHRTSSRNPEVTAKTKADVVATYQYFPADSDGEKVFTSDDPTDEMYAAYFSFVDAGASGSRTGVSYAEYFYSIGSENRYASGQIIPIAGARTYFGSGATDAVTSITRTNLYHFYIPVEVIQHLQDNDAVRIYIVVTTYFEDGEIGVGYDSVELRKIGLLGLT